jgi:outer membrane protein assembly factor BamD (BamD/ComL family)
MIRSTPQALILALLAFPLCGCNAFRRWLYRGDRIDDPAKVPAVLEQAREHAAHGELGRALELAAAARETPGLDPATRDLTEQRVDEYARARLLQLEQNGDVEEMEDLVRDVDLPRQIAVDGAIRAGRMFVQKGEFVDAYNLLREIDKRFPTHHERGAAGECLADAGFALSKMKRGFLGFGQASSATAVLEYLVVNYPSHPRCDEAYFTLAGLYEQQRDLPLARERHEDLLLYHAASPYAVRSEAAVPRLRLASLGSPEYDRGELVRARGELERWLKRHADEELRAEVQLDYTDCLQRLCESDLSIARYYQRLGNPFGASYHAERALKLAQQGLGEKLVARAQNMLDEARTLSESDEKNLGTTLPETGRDPILGVPPSQALIQPEPIVK